MHKYFYCRHFQFSVISCTHITISLERLPQCRIQRCSLITVHKIFQHPAAGVRVFIIAAVCRMKFPHPSAHGYTEQRRRMDHRLIKKTPFLLLYRICRKCKQRNFQLFHKTRIIFLRQRDNFLIAQILVDIRRINLLRRNVL